MTDRDETKKFLYDTELTTPHKVLNDNYDEQLRAVLNYSPRLNVRVLKGFNECPIEVPTEKRWQGTYIQMFGVEMGDSVFWEGTDNVLVYEKPIYRREDLHYLGKVQEYLIMYSTLSLKEPKKVIKPNETHNMYFNVERIETDFVHTGTGQALTLEDLLPTNPELELWFMPTTTDYNTIHVGYI